MKTFPLLLLFCVLTITSCEFSKSVEKDLITGLFTKGDGLSCDDVYLSDGNEKIQRTTFTYGEKIFLNFDDITGFKKENDSAIPGMYLYVIGTTGDTVLRAEDLYANKADGFNESPLLLRADLTVATPIHSGKKYKLSIGIWDKKGEGTFTAQLDFDVIPNALIEVETNIRYDELYLFSRKHSKVITDNTLNAGEDIYMLFEGISGFVVEKNMVYPGLSVQVKDQTGAVVMNYADLFADLSEAGIPAPDLSELVSAQLTFPATMRESRAKCEVTVWDKKGDGKVKATTEIELK